MRARSQFHLPWISRRPRNQTTVVAPQENENKSSSCWSNFCDTSQLCVVLLRNDCAWYSTWCALGHGVESPSVSWFSGFLGFARDIVAHARTMDWRSRYSNGRYEHEFSIQLFLGILAARFVVRGFRSGLVVYVAVYCTINLAEKTKGTRLELIPTPSE